MLSRVRASLGSGMAMAFTGYVEEPNWPQDIEVFLIIEYHLTICLDISIIGHETNWDGDLKHRILRYLPCRVIPGLEVRWMGIRFSGGSESGDTPTPRHGPGRGFGGYVEIYTDA